MAILYQNTTLLSIPSFRGLTLKSIDQRMGNGALVDLNDPVGLFSKEADSISFYLQLGSDPISIGLR